MMDDQFKKQQFEKLPEPVRLLYDRLPDDWRIMGQPGYLLGKTIYRREFQPSHEIYGSRQCNFCFDKFGSESGCQHQGYYEPISHVWICKTCYEDFCKYFSWTVKDWTFSVMAEKPKQYFQTTDVSDYGKFTGNWDNAYAVARITSFFPPRIESDFADVRYSYRANRADAYAYEAYLEFTMKDIAAFHRHLAAVIAGRDTAPFPYDDSFQEFIVPGMSNDFRQDRLVLAPTVETETGGRYIFVADIAKILYSPERKKVIYVSMGVNDGGATSTAFLSSYFSRFQIDPVEYAISHPNQ